MGLDADWLTEDKLNQPDRNGVEFIDNSEEKILDLVRKMNMRLDREWREQDENEKLQALYRKISPAKCFDESPFLGRVSAHFLSTHRALF